MKTNKKRKYIIWGAVIVLLMAVGATAAFAQNSFPRREQTQIPEDNGNPAFDGPNSHGGPRGQRGQRGDNDEALAEALGVTVEELETAQEAVREEALTAVLEQAVADEVITQEEADAALEGDFSDLRDELMQYKDLVDHQALLAEELGVSVEELEATREAVREAQIEQAIEDGRITQEQADMMAARQAVSEYVDHEALQAMIQETYETAVQQALDNGDITQEQADTLLSDEHNFGQRGHGGHGGRGGHGGQRGEFGNNGPQG
ncbi:MAG: hypothetical protein GY805_28785 [Chloroflexi bacterium]|nr:hypothetical protein [Chloroflexota bacterium]